MVYANMLVSLAAFVFALALFVSAHAQFCTVRSSPVSEFKHERFHPSSNTTRPDFGRLGIHIPLSQRKDLRRCKQRRENEITILADPSSCLPPLVSPASH